MKPPTKFQNMRNWRDRTLPVSVYEAPPSVPTMEIDGVRYREAPETCGMGCVDCAFDTGTCRTEFEPWFSAARKAFGGDCMARSVIYIRAE